MSIKVKQNTKEFYPVGAIAFFAFLLMIMASIWLFTYAVMIYRH